MTQPYKFCPQCQTASELAAPFCGNCGYAYPPKFQTPPTQTDSFRPNEMPYMPQGQQYAPVPQDINNKRIIAGILGIVFGGLGIHKFILGRTQAGVIMLLVSILSCGIAAPIMHLIGLVEGIIYLSKSDAEFYQTYIVDKKEWL